MGIFEKAIIFLRGHKRVTLWLLINCSLIFFLNRFSLEKTIFYLVLYAFSIWVATRDFVEKLQVLLRDARPLVMEQEKQRLIPLFEEVKEKSIMIVPHVQNFDLFVVDDMEVNAYAVGKKTIILNRGLLEVATDDEIKSVIAHEMGHIVNGDTLESTIIIIGTGVYVPLLILGRHILKMLDGNTQGARFVLTTLSNIIELLLLLGTIIGAIILSSRQRQMEYSADEYACILGYDNQFLSYLYKMYNMIPSHSKTAFERFKATHPRTPYRIQHVENYIKEKEAKESEKIEKFLSHAMPMEV